MLSFLAKLAGFFVVILVLGALLSFIHHSVSLSTARAGVVPSRTRRVVYPILARACRPQLAILWSYLAYYLVIVSTYPPDDSSVWVNCTGRQLRGCLFTAPFVRGAAALAVCSFVGLALNINAYPTTKPPGLYEHVRANPFMCLRFFAIPFCVSSFSDCPQTTARSLPASSGPHAAQIC